jgi:CRP-like cAMP-binding protein
VNEDISVLQELVNRIHGITPEAQEDFFAIWTRFEVGRKEMITVAGNIEKYIYVVLEGVQRVYYHDREDREATILFTYPPSFGGVLDSFLLQTPSRFYCESLTPSKFLRTSFTEFNRLTQKHHSLDTMVRKGLTGVIAGLEERLVEIQCFSSEDKFRSLLKRSPHILQLVPHKYIASYLGIDPTNFSKLMNKVRI